MRNSNEILLTLTGYNTYTHTPTDHRSSSGNANERDTQHNVMEKRHGTERERMRRKRHKDIGE